MRNFRRYTFLVLAVAILIALSGVAIYVLLPARITERSNQALTRQAMQMSEYLATRAGTPMAAGDSAAVASLFDVVEASGGISYVVVTDAAGHVVASRGRAVAGMEEWRIPEDTQAPAVLSSARIATSTGLAGYVHVGVARLDAARQAAGDLQLVTWFTAFLFLLAGSAAFSVVKMQKLKAAVEEWQLRHRSLRMQTGTLQTSVKEHKQTEHALRQSEEKYRSLFQSAMSSAMKDLEELNRNLEKRKVELEQEVGVRQRAEAALRSYTVRLQMMNEVERTMLEGKSLGDSVDAALARLSELLPATALALLEIESDRDEVVLLGRVGDAAADAWLSLDDNELGELADGTKEIRYEADVQKSVGAPSSIQRRFIKAGLNSYCYVPLVIEQDTVGLLVLGAEEAGAFTDESFDIGRDMADLMAIGIRQSRMNSQRERYEAELIAAKDRAEEMARLKSAFLTNMSHEIRTPISGIMGFAQVLHDEAPESLREFTGLIQEAANRLLNTINSVLELARLESGRLSFEMKPIDLSSHVTEASRLIEPIAMRKGISLIIEPSASPVIARLDRGCTERIVNNLVGNAIKFTESGHVRVSVLTDERHAVLKVDDTGVGIAEEFLPHLFDEFRQEQMDANREHEGSGLGLAITKKLVDRLGGFIEVTSVKGEGTTFTVQFPLYDVNAAGDAGAGKDALVVAPHADSATLLSRNLGPGYVATEVSSLEAGRSILNERGFTVAVVDVNGMVATDHALLYAIRKAFPELRLVAVATQVLPDNVAELTEMGFDTFVADPFEGENLARSVRGHAGAADRMAIRNGHRDRQPAVPGAIADRKWSL